jgi:hypothetical protein
MEKTNQTSLIIYNLILFSLCLSLLLFHSISYANDSIIYSGFSFVGNYSENQERYPYATELLSETAENGMPVLDYALREVMTQHYQRPEKLIDSQKDVDSGTTLALAFGLSQESVEKVGWKNKNLYVYRVLAQVMIFDFNQKLLLANFPAMLQHQEIDKNVRDVQAHRKVFKQIYLDTHNKEKSIFYEWVTRLNSIVIKGSYPFFLKVESLEADPDLLKQLPKHLSQSAYISEIVQLFETVLSKEQGVSLVPYTKGQAVGAKMPMRFSDATVLQLELPAADFLFEINLHSFKHMMNNDGNCHKHAFGAFATISLSLSASKKEYIKQRFKKVNFAVFSAKDNVDVDIWHSQQTTLRSLFVEFSKQISQRDKMILSEMVKNTKRVKKQLKEVEEVIFKCR